MRNDLRWIAPLAPALAGLAASAALVVDYVRPAPVFCDGASACAAMKQTAFASFLGVPTPVYGVAAFLAFAALSLQRGARVRVALLVASAIGAAVALLLLGVQARMHTFCRFCVVTDASACLLFALAAWRARAAWDPPASLAPRASGGAVAAMAVATPLVFGFTRTAPVPEVIASEIGRTPDGRVTVVDFVDFECPFCRMTHAALAPVLDANRAHVRVVRKQVPLSRIHAHALAAARAACCGEALGKGDAMADALFSAPVDDLTPEGCEQLATSIGLDAAAFRACVQDPKTDARIQADTAEFKAAQGHGLPTLWIDRTKIEGAQPPEVIEAAVKDAVARRG